VDPRHHRRAAGDEREHRPEVLGAGGEVLRAVDRVDEPDGRVAVEGAEDAFVRSRGLLADHDRPGQEREQLGADAPFHREVRLGDDVVRIPVRVLPVDLVRRERAEARQDLLARRGAQQRGDAVRVRETHGHRA
jgi:hypothetical protein